MTNQLSLAAISALSGIAGILISQALTGLFSYAGDRRKTKNEIHTIFRNRQVEIAENFYFVTSEKMAIVKENIGYWQNWNHSRSEASLEFLNKEMVKLNAYLEKLDAENWKCNLINLYFEVSLTKALLIAVNGKSKALFLKVLDLTDELRHALPHSKADIYELYDDAIREMCTHYEQIYAQMTDDLCLVKQGLIREMKG